MLDHLDDPAVLHWDYAEGDGDIHTYVWLQALDYLIVMKKYRDGRRRLITAFWLEYENKRRKLAQKYAQRLLWLPGNEKANAHGVGPTPSALGR